MTFFTGELEEQRGVLAVHGWKFFKEILKGIPGGKVIEQRLSFHPGSLENQSAAEDSRVGLNRTVVQRDHGKE
jgi:hypothetical protein